MKQFFLLLLLLFSYTSQAQFTWSFEDRIFNAGDTVQARVWVSGFDSIGAFQYSLEYDSNNLMIRLDTPFTFTGLIPYTSEEFSHGLQAGLSPYFYYPKNQIKTVWADPDSFTYPNGHVYTIWFIARQSSTICESIKVLNGPFDMPIEAWHQNLITPVELIAECIPLRKPERVDFPIPSRENLEEIKIYPNPTSEFIYVDSTEPVEVTVFNQLGQLTFSNKVYSKDQPIFIEQGVNIVRIISKDKTILKQVYKF